MIIRTVRRLVIAGGAGAAGLLGLIALAGAPAAAQPLIVNVADAPATLDLAWGCGFPDISFPQSFYVQLTQYGHKAGPDGTTQYDPANIVPYFAKSWTITEGGTVYTFKLHENLTFSSGNPVDAAAVKYSFERTLKINGCGAYFLLDGFYTPPLISSIETPDAYTVVINLAHPDPNALQIWGQPSGSIYDAAVIEDHGGVEAGKQNEWLASNTTGGAGPFLLAEYEPNTGAVMKANPDYFDAPPRAEEIRVNWISSEPTLLLKARNGEADVTLGLSLNSVRSLEDNDDIRIIANPTTQQQEIGMLNGKPPFDNVLVREAATYAIPYQQILDRVAFGYGSLFFGPFMPGIPAYNEGLSGARSFDMALAKELMQRSGIQTPVDVEMVVREGFTIHDQIAAIVQGTWRELGLNVRISRLSPSEYMDVTQGHKAQSYIRINGPGVIDAGYYLGYDMVCGMGFNLTEVCIEEADEALKLARQETDPVKQQALYDKITRLWNAASPKIPVYAVRVPSVLNKRVTQYHYVHETDFRFWSIN